MNISINDISDSSDIIWEAVCIAEDGNMEKAIAMIADCSKIDRAIFTAEVSEIFAKRADKIAANRPTVKRSSAPVITAGTFDYEAAILAHQEDYAA